MSFSLKADWLYRLLGANWRQLCLSEQELIVDQQPALPLSELCARPLIEPGILSATLRLSLTEGRQLRLRALPKAQAQALADRLDSQRYPLLAPWINAEAEALQQALQQPGYLRRERFLALQQRARQAVARFVEPPPAERFDEGFRKPFEWLRALAEADDSLLTRHQQRFITAETARFAAFFDNVESNPLTERQRTACVIDERNNLVLAGAGTGKTSTLVGRAGYLIKSGKIQPNQILMLAFASKAADEMRQRLSDKLGAESTGLAVYTFHALGRQIIAQVEGAQPDMTLMAEDTGLRRHYVDQCFNHLLQQDEGYKRKALRYFARYLYPAANPFEFKNEGDYLNFLVENEIVTLKGEQVRGYQECLIANFLFRNGIEYQYEARYRVDTRTPQHRAYHPDFYLPEFDLYIEHFGIDRQGNTAPWIDPAAYQAGIDWKRATHARHGTTLIESFHYQWLEGSLLSTLEQNLKRAGVQFRPLPAKAVLDTLREFGAVSKMSELLHAMLGRAKAGNYDHSAFQQLVREAEEPDYLQAAIDLLEPILDHYQRLLQDNRQIDFDDMINRAIDHVRSGRFRSPWRQIMVDEFQDISRPRAELIKALKEQVEGATLFCVGDDWQSIYRFTGSDLSLTTGFAEFFGPSAVTALDKTYRFNNRICELASAFVMRNPAQVRKQLQTHRQVEQPAVSLLRCGYGPKEADKPLRQVLTRLAEIAEPDSSVLLLARYGFSLPDADRLAALRRAFPKLRIGRLTIHASKGREADYVVVLDMVSGQYGFPTEKQSHPLLEAMLPAPEPYAHAEERRLFYVALTRARHRVYLISDMSRASIFIKELVEDDYPLVTDEFDTALAQQLYQLIGCPRCQSGTLQEKQGPYGRFYGCSLYPRCDHSEPGCPSCQAPMQRQHDIRRCLNPQCGDWQPSCPQCQAPMVRRSGKNGEFWGCSRYRGDQPDSCKGSRSLVSIAPPSEVATD